MPKRYIAWKWTVYAAAALLLLLLQAGVLNYVTLWGVTPLLPPMAVGLAASFEGSRASPLFALGLGVLCDLGGTTPAVGFFTFFFPFSALLAALLAENLFSPGWLCSLVSVSVCYAVVDLGRISALLLRGEQGAGLMFSVAAREFLVTLPLLLLFFPLYRRIHRKTTVDY